jgi:predicted ATP-dependent endonuclease of OLD family
MSAHPIFSRFKIDGLRGSTDIDVTIEDNVLVMVGENGSGKTTFLRILFYFLSGRWPRLAQFNFNRVSAIIDGQEYAVNHNDIKNILPSIDERNLSRLPISQRRHFSDLVETGRVEEANDLLNHLTLRYGLSVSKQRELPLEKLDTFGRTLGEIQEQLSNNLGSQILYLPTYRRIERELSSIVQGIDPDDLRRPMQINRQAEDANDYVELVEFGMNDVRKAIDSTLEEIRNFQLQGTTRLSLSYLGDVVSQAYLSTDSDVIANTSEETIEAVLNRIDDTILSGYHKSHLREIILSAQTSANMPSEHERIIYHYFTKLIQFQDELQIKESRIKQFCGLCSEYITDKRLIYESGRPSFKIEYNMHGGNISLSDLSSGEKQIVSLFSHLYLSGRERFFVLIDEPELSLSVPWQRRFLCDIIDGSFCSGLVAVTHSPFIYDNRLRPHTHALGEFISNSDWGNIR